MSEPVGLVPSVLFGSELMVYEIHTRHKEGISRQSLYTYF